MYWIVSVNTVDYKKVQFRLHYIALACLAPSPPVTHRSVAWSCAMSDRLHNFCLHNRRPKYEFGHQPVQCCMLRIPQAARIALASQDRSRWWGGECMFALYAPPRVVAGPGWVKGSNMQNISLSDVVARAHVNTGSGGSQPPISRQAVMTTGDSADKKFCLWAMRGGPWIKCKKLYFFQYCGQKSSLRIYSSN